MKIGTKLFVYKNGNEILYMSDGDFLRKNVINWKYNRPPDLDKVSKISLSISNKNTIEGIIYIAKLNNNFVCYDGNHRLEALKLCKNKDKKLVLVNIMYVNEESEIKKRFINLNQSNPVPELYMTNDDNNKLKNIIETEVITLCGIYSKYRSTSNNPNRPNFNRDNIINKLYLHYNNKQNDDLTVNKLHNKLLDLNSMYAKGKHINFKNISQRILNKCAKHGCFLFLKDFTEDL
jgi:hypothetical protein